ncbi:porin family protein, partial [Escherichia coli]|nr:porin family protein [Escherichia coli]
MKKLLALTAVAALTGTFSTLALADADKTGFYIT